MSVGHDEHRSGGPTGRSVQNRLGQSLVVLAHIGQQGLDLPPVQAEISWGELDNLAANPPLVEPERRLNPACDHEPARRAEVVQKRFDQSQGGCGTQVVKVVEHENDVVELIEIESNRGRDLLDLDCRR